MKTNLSAIEWYEELPSGCPPTNSLVCNGTFFRISLSDPANTADFFSQRKLKPSYNFEGIDECTVRSLSVFDTFEAAKSRLKLPKFKNAHIARVDLCENDGRILKTFGPQHYSWWRSKGFDIKKAVVIF